MTKQIFYTVNYFIIFRHSYVFITRNDPIQMQAGKGGTIYYCAKFSQKVHEKQDCILVGCVPPACCPYVLGGGSGPRGFVWSCDLWCMLGYPPMDRMTDTCKNVTFAYFVCRR